MGHLLSACEVSDMILATGMGIEQSVIATILQTTGKIFSSWMPQEKFLIYRPVPRAAIN
jgi:hypothetical protein